MRHARADYDRIQDPAELIPEDEPVFLIRGQDEVGAAAVRAWANLHRINGGSDHVYLLAMKQADKMEAWPKKKLADLPQRVSERERGRSQPVGTADESANNKGNEGVM